MRSSVFGLPECMAGNITGMVVVPGPKWALESVTAASVYPSCRRVGGQMIMCEHKPELATQPDQKHTVLDAFRTEAQVRSSHHSYVIVGC
jgi:hypothetical protein